MLSLDNPRWRTLKTYYPGSDRLPGLVERWEKTTGAKKALVIWYELVDYILQQFTIKEAAYAVVPHVVARLREMPPKQRYEYLLDVGLIEAGRGHPYAPRLPRDLSAAYRSAIQ